MNLKRNKFLAKVQENTNTMVETVLVTVLLL